MTATSLAREWDDAELALLESSPLIRVAAERPDGSLRPFTVIGHVRLGGDELIRALRGETAAWYRAAVRTARGRIEVAGRRIAVVFDEARHRPEAVDGAYRSRYGDDGGVRAMTRPPARDTTLRVRPASDPAP
jgi:hypothetical protein